MKLLTASASVLLLLTPLAQAENPFLSAADDQPVSAVFVGSEWGDELDGKELSLSARVSTTRIAQAPWGAIYRIDFNDIKSRAPEPRRLTPEYFIVTDERIVLLNEQDNEAAAKKLMAAAKAPTFEPGDVYGISSGKFTHDDGPWTTKIEVKGDTCTYSATHGSGHFKTVVWKKGAGLIEYASGYGARADGYRLKRAPDKSLPSKRPKK